MMTASRMPDTTKPFSAAMSTSRERELALYGPVVTFV
jgi:hypothetical protein